LHTKVGLRGHNPVAGLIPRSVGITQRQAIGAALSVIIVLAASVSARADTLDEVIEALKIRQHLYASQEECRAAALKQVRPQITASIQAQLTDRALSNGAHERMEALSQTYAREACQFGVEDGLIQYYRAAYAAALSQSDLAALQGFLSSPEGKKFVAAGLAANRDVLKAVHRRQKIQVTRAITLLQARMQSLISKLSDDR